MRRHLSCFLRGRSSPSNCSAGYYPFKCFKSSISHCNRIKNRKKEGNLEQEDMEMITYLVIKM